MKKLVRYNLEVFSVIMLVFILVTLIFWREMSLVKKLAAGFMLLYTLHEWEESRFPGGFYDLFFGRVGAEIKGDRKQMHIPAAIAILIITILPYLFDTAYLLLLPPLCLALFEGFIHTVGIALMKVKQPYTPGMVTAWLMFAFAVYCIKALPPLSAGTWIGGIALLIIEFIAMQSQFIRLAGYSYRTLFPLVKKNILGLQ